MSEKNLEDVNLGSANIIYPTPKCPRCGSTEVFEVGFTYDGKTGYICRKCEKQWEQ